jgi:Mg-chelatase subunit ChlI
MSDDRVNLHIHIPYELKKKLKIEAMDRRMNTQDLCAEIFIEYFNKKE